MPPRITRLRWPQLFPPHEPLPFLYPRWYSIQSATVETSAPGLQHVLGPEQPLPQESNEPKSTRHQTKKQDAVLESHDEGIARRVPQVIKRKAQIRKLQETKRREMREKGFYANDWRTPLMLLRKHTPEGEEHHVKHLARLEMPKGMRGFYPGELPNLFLDIYLHTGCHVQISRSDGHADDKFSALDVSGTLASIQRAKKILNEAVRLESDTDAEAKGSMGSYATTTTSIPVRKAMPRSVWSMRHKPKELSDVIVPSQWSFKAFAAHVDHLVLSTPPRLQIRKQGASRPKSHVETVTERIVALYTSKDTVRWASMHATVQTLQYLSQHRKVPEVRRVLELIDLHSKIIPHFRLIFTDPATFNVLLHSAAEALDLHNYNFLLRMMLDRNVVPDTATWTTLLHLVQKVHPRSAKHVITTMRSRNMLSSPSAKIATANEGLQKDAVEWLGRGESVFDFIAHYDKLWLGREWLDTRACNQLLPLLIESGKLEDAMILVGELESRHGRPNHVTTHILLDAASAYRDLNFAVRALEATMSQRGKGALRPTRDTFDKLIPLAYRVRAYNTLRVIWRYACLSGNASPKLVRKMQKSLLAPIPSTTQSEGPLHVGQVEVEGNIISRNLYFKAMAAKVAVGIERSLSVDSIKRLIASASFSADEGFRAAAESATVSETPEVEATTSADSAVEREEPLDTANPEQQNTSTDSSSVESTTTVTQIAPWSDASKAEVTTSFVAAVEAERSLDSGSPDQEPAPVESPAADVPQTTTEPAATIEAQKIGLETCPSTTRRPSKTPLPQALISDILAYDTYKAGSPFTTMFRKAVERDIEWRLKGYDKHAPLGVLLKEALNLNIDPKG
ncbi:hypothetical protein AUEXF2481DRAFT_32036 [Aureobasidium subglaciale EXF-2481]|uniref:Pentatricopeptide repeat domain-containing protein n=1 Tax=Aureobasidium subglaciale (strain EXF-2481) TaxID=1043005 RepID=A0A074Y3R8_AURSE|nr:uncharacterized protein AUEXF2481DRAFT_32036 [Aureobasidium subglaciale EXF-2481]KAI5210868.1 hypothetical protein E4T38_01836 [Aureobasidium subglaciale]KAI5229371.1 hypothetical protein E4T40_01643 [Aureobasidium subglaciale]KAI5232889.1 hypothetical protein E4T41_01834 [Aureobasidium subglaciale]KAI5266314.1 hypothetical protein E4T46_01640 [Aureobasidium subglaciale]KEQ92438.1 hypothetical protein AUEXF2481DRAFT_32036 [Aureobasidium subglaciale EXF-2481]